MQDLRDGFRALTSTPIVTLVAILSLALGIGANTAIFSLLNSLLLRQLPVQEPERLALVTMGQTRASWTNPQWEHLRDRRDLFGATLAWATARFNLSESGQTNFAEGIWASGRYFDELGVRPVLGRTFTEADDRRGGGTDGPVAVISYGFWQRQFAGAPDVVGRRLTLDLVAYTVIGVTPPEFFGTDVGRAFDVAVPLGTEPLIRGRESALDRRSTWWLNIMVRLAPGQTLDEATTALRGVQPGLREATMPEHYRPEDRARYLSDPLGLSPAATGNSVLRQRYQRPLLALMGVVALVLLIACANIANLLLARATARRHELSVRLALGASRGRLARQLLVESLMLSGAGALAGLMLALWASRLLVTQISTSTTRVHLDLATDWRILLFTTAIGVGAALLFGMAPALRAASVQPNDALKERGRGQGGERGSMLGNLLVVAQVALSLTLVVGAGLFVRTFTSLANLDPGFRSDGVMIASVNAQRVNLEPDARSPFYEQLREAAARVPGVQVASLSIVTPVGGSRWNTIIEIPGAPPAPENERFSNVNFISPAWFDTMGTRLLAGRDFTAQDTASSPRVAIVNQAFARRYFGGENPVGRTVREPGFGKEPTREFEIVGYAQDAVYNSLREELSPIMYHPLAQGTTPPFVAVSVRAGRDAAGSLTRDLTQALTGVSRDIAITFRPLEEQVRNSLAQERLVALLSGFFGVLALLLAGLGLYGVTSYAVNRRRGEIGIRMALGADPGRVIRLVLRRVAILVAAGAVLGIALSIGLGRYVETLLYGLEPRDPLTMAVAAVTLGLLALAAGLIPARRAARIDPAEVLRSEG